MCWEILEIEETKDIKKITFAYRKKLVNTNPEDKPEEFKILRQAYEQALDYAKDNTTKKSEIEVWKEQLADVYNNFQKRIQLKEWQLLLNTDICLALDKKLLIEETLLHYFMDHYRIPHEIWTYLNELFSFTDRTQELYDQYPKEFIDYIVMSGIQFEDALPYHLFTPGQNGDEVEQYITFYLEARNESFENAMPLVEQMETLSESHPYGTILKTNLLLSNGLTTSIEPLKELYEKYPNEEYIRYSYAYSLNDVGQYELCEQICRTLTSYHRVQWLLANCLANQKRYKEAIENLHDIMNSAGGDQLLVFELNQKRAEWNTTLIEQYEQTLHDDFDNHQNRVDLTWAYLQNDFYDKAYALADTLEKDKMEPFDFNNLMSNIYISKNDFEKAIPYTNEVIEILKNMEDDGNPKTQKRLKRYPEMLNRKGYCLIATGQDEQALEIYNEALQASNDDAEILTRLCQISISRMDYDKAEYYAHRLVKSNPAGYHGYLLLAYAYFYKRYDREAFEAINTCLEIFGGDLDAYILKTRILIRNSAFEAAQEIIDFLEQNGLSNDTQILFCKGLLKEIGEENDDEALQYYLQAARNIKEVGMYNFGAELYYRILLIRGLSCNVTVDKDFKEMLKWANKGLKENKKHYGLKDYKAWLYLKRNKLKEALKLYKELEQIEDHSPEIEAQIGYIYYQTLEKDAQISLEYYLKSIEAEDSGNKRFYAGMCYLYLGQLEEAEQQFLTLQQMNPNGLDSYFRLSFVYQAMNQLDKALENINKTIEIVASRQGDQSRYYHQKIQILRRMNKMDEAIETVHEIENNYNFTNGYSVITSICRQGAKWDQAKECIQNWKQKDHYNPKEEIRMYITFNEFDKAKEVFEKYKDSLSEEEFIELSRDLARVEVNLEEELMWWHKLEDFRSQYKGSDMSQVYMHLAHCYFKLDNKEKQVFYAKKALRIINQHLKKNELNHTLYIGRKAQVLALLGKKEAYELVEQAKKMALCDFCPYCKCKDADIYDVVIETVFGNIDIAKQKADEYTLKWPDEEDFNFEIEYLKKRMIE